MKRVVVVSAIASLAIFIACSSDSSDATPSRTVVSAGTSSSSSTSSGGADTTPDGGGGAGGDEDANVDPSCESDAGCFTCAATRSIDILNSCTDDQCSPFDNVARLPLYVAGQPLPAIP